MILNEMRCDLCRNLIIYDGREILGGVSLYRRYDVGNNTNTFNIQTLGNVGDRDNSHICTACLKGIATFAITHLTSPVEP